MMIHLSENTDPIMPPAPVCFLLVQLYDGAIIEAQGQQYISVVKALGPAALLKKNQQIRVKLEPAGSLEVTEGVEGCRSSVSALQTHAAYETQTRSPGNYQRRAAVSLMLCGSLISNIRSLGWQPKLRR